METLSPDLIPESVGLIKKASTKVGLWGLAILIGFCCLVSLPFVQPKTQLSYLPQQLGQPTEDEKDKITGFFQPQVDAAGNTYVWTAPRATLRFPFESSRPLVLKVELRSATTAGGPNKPVVVLVNGLHVGEFQPDPTNPDFQQFSLKFVPIAVKTDLPSDPLPLSVELISPTFAPSNGDIRQLGTMVKSLTLDREEAWSAIGKRMWLFWSLPLLGLMALGLFWLGRRFRFGGPLAWANYGASLLCLVGLGFMVAAIALLSSIGVIDRLTFPLFLISSLYLGLLFGLAAFTLAWTSPVTQRVYAQLVNAWQTYQGRPKASHSPLVTPTYLRLTFATFCSYKKIISTPEKLFLVLGLFFGILFGIFTPPYQVPDEISHMTRAYKITDGLIISKTIITDMPTSLYLNVCSISSLPGRPNLKVSVPCLLAMFGAPLKEKETLPTSMVALSYPPVSYLPAASAIAVGRAFGASPILLTYLGRFANLFFSTLLIYFAIKITPIFKWVFLLFALSPMMLHETVSLSADSFTNSSALLFLSLILSYALDERKKFTFKSLLLLILLAIAIGLSKQTYVTLLFLYFLIPVKKIGGLVKYWLSGVLVLLSGFGSVALWSFLSSGIALTALEALPSSPSPSQQIRFILSDPIGFLQRFPYSFIPMLTNYLDAAIGFRLGWLDTAINGFLIFSIEVYLIFLALTDHKAEIKIGLLHKLKLIAIFGLTVLGIVTSAYVAWMGVGSKALTTLQGRYFLPALPLLLLLFYNRKVRLNLSLVKQGLFLIIFTLLVLGATLYSISTRYFGDLSYIPLDVSSGTLTNEVLPNKGITQSFICRVDTLRDIALMSGPEEGRGSNAEFDLILQYDQTELFHYKMALSELRNNKLLTVALPKPLEKCNGRTLYLRIESQSTTKGTNLRFWSYSKYYEGKLLVHNQDQVNRNLGLVLNSVTYDMVKA